MDESLELQSEQPVRELTRKEYRQLLDRKRKRRMRRRRARLRRIRVYKSIRSLQFWTRVAMLLVVGLCIAFWARFAFVYDIPSYARDQLPGHVTAYVTVKPWWFGPPVFDLGQYVPIGGDFPAPQDPYQYLLLKLGRYGAVLEHPQFVWTSRS
ncbi:hypothetical protein [Alicyclobacillus dauci]|uniref:Uncharacterized protein n=1 Tax=Alicyclobacillus dauci TaxID=1475485 RepID=A0ABY6Z2K5_9BACL|nr:hypothetical protein [Alicyclobacillus dauci]WAH36984.1 hypothetical protein NZD86_22980 [Alicyclobacillus dauci]